MDPFFVDGYVLVKTNKGCVGGVQTSFVCMGCYLHASDTIFEEGWQVSHGRDPQALSLGVLGFDDEECYLCQRLKRRQQEQCRGRW